MLGITIPLKKTFYRENLDTGSLLSLYRYGSLLITSLFYFLGPPPAPWYLKAGVSVCLLAEALAFTRVYQANGGKFARHILIAIETTGLALLLIITGGLDSPFLWYAVNPILLAVTLLPIYFCWSMAAAFLTLAFSLHQFRLYSLEPSAPLWPDRSNFILIFILITFAAQLFSYLISRLSRQNMLVEKQIRHIKSLYEAIDVLSRHSSPKEIINLFASYSKALTGAVKAIVWMEMDLGLKEPQTNVLYAVRGPRRILVEETWYNYIKQLFETGNTDWETDIYSLPADAESKGALLSVRIRSNTRFYGLLSTFHQDDSNLKEVEKTLHFLADICAMLLEKRSAEALAEELLLLDEKDRIAGEIHDKVTQNIFGLIYGLDYLIKQEDISEPVKQRVRLMQKTAQQSLRDLRESIYNLSSTRQNNQPFSEELKTYLHNLGQVNDVNVDFTSKGNFHRLKPSAQSALYRIIREATANSIRHGFCNNIQVYLGSENGGIRLSISDDGHGFNPEVLQNSDKAGLGLINMQEQAHLLGGKLQIDSVLGKGTRIYCETVPGDATSPREGQIMCEL